MRALAGDVPYRDFWTMYAPGSFVTLAGAFSLFGRELIVSNERGILRPWLPWRCFTGWRGRLPARAPPRALVAQDAGPDLWDNLIRFPLVDFRHVRCESFPLVPRFGGTKTDMVMQLQQWAICNLPSVGIGLGLWGVRRRWSGATARVRFVVVFAVGAFCFHWMAAHVQLNTNAISLAAWGTLAGGIGLSCLEREQRIRLSLPVLVSWGSLFVAPPVNRLRRESGSHGPVDLPGLRGIRMGAGIRGELVGLAEAMGAAVPAEAPILFISNRNDVVVAAQAASIGSPGGDSPRGITNFILASRTPSRSSVECLRESLAR